MKRNNAKRIKWTVVDLFSGAGGMSYGFHAHPAFKLVAAVDAQIGKPSSGVGSLDCNETYKYNFGIVPFEADLAELDGKGLCNLLEPALQHHNVTVLSACPPCTGFSRTNPNNHLKDDPRNSLVTRVTLWVEALKPSILIMENARELISGKFSHHYQILKTRLSALGYNVDGKVHVLDKFGLPQKRERALVLAVKAPLKLRTLEELWEGYKIKVEATHVRRAISRLPLVEAGEIFSDDPMHISPRLGASSTYRRIQLMPHDGGSWIDLRDHREAPHILTPAMKNYILKGKFGSHPDVYGRLWWDRPAVTIKRECAHIGNGRYSHPEQDRLCTVREMAILQGFPRTYQFVSTSLSNMYRHIGDAVPPLISYQLACLIEWILSGNKPKIEDCILTNTNLTREDIISIPPEPKQEAFVFTSSSVHS